MQSKLRKRDPVRVSGSVYSITIDWSYLEGMLREVLVTMRLDYRTECRFEGEEVGKIMKLPEGQEVIIEGVYSHESVSRAFLSDCSLLYP